MKSYLISVPILLLLGCGLFDGTENKKPTLVGEWQSTAQFEFTVGDSLYRDSLDKYLLARGFDIDSFFTIGSSYSGDAATFDSLVGEFVWNCPVGVACGERLWIRSNRRRFTADSVFTLNYTNEVVSDSFATPYSITEDSLLQPISPDLHFGVRYEIRPTGDTLILYGSLSLTSHINDTLIKLD